MEIILREEWTGNWQWILNIFGSVWVAVVDTTACGRKASQWRNTKEDAVVIDTSTKRHAGGQNGPASHIVVAWDCRQEGFTWSIIMCFYALRKLRNGKSETQTRRSTYCRHFKETEKGRMSAILLEGILKVRKGQTKLTSPQLFRLQHRLVNIHAPFLRN